MRATNRRSVALLWLLFCGATSGLGANPRTPGDDAKPADYSQEAFVVERLSTRAAFESDGTYSLETTARVRIQSQAGVQGFGLLKFPYASATSTMEVAYMRVIKPDNRTVETPAENILDMPAQITQEAPFYSDIKELQVAVKGLEAGDTIEYQTHAQVKKPLAPGQFWFSYNFFQSGIMLQEELQISVPRDRYVKVESPKVQPAAREEGAYRIYTWKTANLQHTADRKTTGTQSADESSWPSVEVSSFRSWDEVGQWFRSLAAPRAVPTPEIQAKAQQLTAGAKMDLEKTRAIYNFVSTKFRYIGVALGIGRYQPHAAADVLTNDYGDCKDKHTLLAALLAAAGVKAYPALINSGGEIDAQVPSPLQFDHVITAVPQDKGYLFLDSTPEVASFGHLLPNLRDKKALVIPDNGPAVLVQTPEDPPFPSLTIFQADATLDDSGTLVSKMKITLHGDAELAYRAAFRQAGQSQWKEVMQQISSNLGFGGTVSDVTATPPDALDSPFHIEYSYNRLDYSDWANKRISPPFSNLFLPDAPDEANKVLEPIKLGSPEEIVQEATLKLPVSSNPQLPSSAHLQESFAEYRSTYSFSDGVLHVERRLTTKARKIPPEQIEAYRKFHKAVSDDMFALIPVFAGTAGSSEAQEFLKQGQEAWQQRNLTGAAEAFQRAVDKDPKFIQGWLSLGALHVALGDIEQGFDEMKKAIDLDPTQASTYKYAGSVLASARRPEEALEVWKELEKAQPDDPDAPRNIGLILGLMKRYAEAVPEMERAVARKPDDPAMLALLGGAYLRLGDKEKAWSRLQKALESNPSDDVMNTVAYDLAENDFHLEEALHYGEQAVRTQETRTAKISLDNLRPEDTATPPRLAAYWDTLGWVHFRMGHVDQAERYLNSAWYITQSPLMADHLGQLYEKEGKTHEAAVAYAHALSAGPAPEGTRARRDALRPDGKFLPGEEINPTSLQDFRMAKVQVARKPSRNVSAELFLLFAPGPKVAGVKFLSGAEELRDAEKAVTAAKYEVRFPDDNSEQILRRAVLSCEPEIPGCTLALFPANAAYSVK